MRSGVRRQRPDNVPPGLLLLNKGILALLHLHLKFGLLLQVFLLRLFHGLLHTLHDQITHNGGGWNLRLSLGGVRLYCSNSHFKIGLNCPLSTHLIVLTGVVILLEEVIKLFLQARLLSLQFRRPDLQVFSLRSQNAFRATLLPARNRMSIRQISLPRRWAGTMQSERSLTGHAPRRFAGVYP
jgi:hypothetical protein